MYKLMHIEFVLIRGRWKCGAWKWRTWNWRTNLQGMKLQDVKN